ncbi:hypothetical protein ABBQ38_000849 [Trebouxia sp. C0009 RCD-2024]
MKSVKAFAVCSWLCFVICGPQLVAGVNSIVYGLHGPGTEVAWYEAGISVTVPQGFIARKDRSHAVLELFSQEDLSVTDLQTVVLRNNLAEMLESGVLGLVNTFCLNPGTSLQEMLQVAPYYLLDSNTSVADILFFDPTSPEDDYASEAQGAFRSNTTDNSALMTLVGNAYEGIGVSIVLITQTVDTESLKNATSSILQGLNITVPLVPKMSGQDVQSWTEMLNNQRLSVTSVAARPLDSHFDAYSNGSCTAVLQGTSQRQGTWSVVGKCLNESTLFGNVYHALGLEKITGNINFGSQRWSVGQAIPEASAGGQLGEMTQANTTAPSPCTFTQPAGTVAAPGECRNICVLPNGTAALPNEPCTIGVAPDTTCTTCASVFGNLLTIDISALPATVNTRYIDVCGGNCPYVEYLDMLQFVTEGLCNASCFANEVNWAASYLMQPVNQQTLHLILVATVEK